MTSFPNNFFSSAITWFDQMTMVTLTLIQPANMLLLTMSSCSTSFPVLINITLSAGGCTREILAPKNDTVNTINAQLLLLQIPMLIKTYISLDTVPEQDQVCTTQLSSLTHWNHLESHLINCNSRLGHLSYSSETWTLQRSAMGSVVCEETDA